MRIYTQDFCMADAMPFQQHYEARTEFPIDKIVASKEAFLNVRGNLRVGDRVTICSYVKVNHKAGTAEDLRGFANVRVKNITSDSVELLLEAHPVKVDAPVFKPVEEDTAKLSVKKVFGGGFGVFDKHGNALDQFKTKAEAQEYALRGERAAA